MGVALLSPLRAFSKASSVSISPSTYPAVARGAVPSSASLSGLRTPQPYGCGVLGGSAVWAVRRGGKTINLLRTHVGATAAYSQPGYNAQGYDAPSYGASTSPVPDEIAWDKDLVNNVSMIGRLGRDPMLKVLGNNMTVADTSLAVARATKAGIANKEVDWVDLTFWNELALQAKDHLSQGQQVHVQGRLKQDKWQDKNTGQTRSSLKLTVFALHRVRSDNFPDNTERPGPPADGSYGAQNTNYSNQSNQRPSESARSQPPSAPQYEYPAASSKSFQPATDQKPFSEAEPTFQTNTFKQQYAPKPNASDTEEPKSAKKLKTEADWKSCLTDPNRWWDNRLMKKNTKAPDFKHKDTGDALWLNGFDTPAWVHQGLNNLGSPTASGGAPGGNYSAPSSSPPPPVYGGNEPLPEDPPF